MATKSTHKKIPLNKKKELARKLDLAAQNVVKRGVFVPVRKNNYYIVTESFSNKYVLHYVPTKKLAQTLCVRLNRRNTTKEPLKTHEINIEQRKMNKYMDLFNETKFFTAILDSDTVDDFRKEVAFIRMTEVVNHMKHLYPSVANLF